MVLDIGSYVRIICPDPTSVAKIQVLNGVVVAYDNNAVRILIDGKSHVVLPWTSIISIQVLEKKT